MNYIQGVAYSCSFFFTKGSYMLYLEEARRDLHPQREFEIIDRTNPETLREAGINIGLYYRVSGEEDRGQLLSQLNDDVVLSEYLKLKDMGVELRSSTYNSTIRNSFWIFLFHNELIERGL